MKSERPRNRWVLKMFHTLKRCPTISIRTGELLHCARGPNADHDKRRRRATRTPETKLQIVSFLNFDWMKIVANLTFYEWSDKLLSGWLLIWSADKNNYSRWYDYSSRLILSLVRSFLFTCRCKYRHSHTLHEIVRNLSWKLKNSAAHS